MNKPPASAPEPGGLFARMFRQKAKPQAESAATKLSAVPEVINMTAWSTQHLDLLHKLRALALRAASDKRSVDRPQLAEHIGKVHAALKGHTSLIAGDAVPSVLAVDSKVLIPYERLAESRAKVQMLKMELAQLRERLAVASAEGWRPYFDGLSFRQETLAAAYCEEICGGPGKFARRPSKARLLEMARTLYEAERDELTSEKA